MSPNLIPSLLAGNPLKIDWTGFSGVEKCFRYSWHRQDWNRESVREEWELLFGRALHAGLDCRQKSLMAGEPVSLADVEQAVEEVFREECPECGGTGELIANEYGATVSCSSCQGKGQRFREPDDEDEYRTVGRAKDVMGLYCKRYPGELFRVLASEQGLEAELGKARWWEPKLGWVNSLVIWQGRVDGIWQRTDSGRLAVKDSKHMKQYDAQRESLKYKMSGQLQGYCWLAEAAALLPGLGKIREAVIDVLEVRKPLVKPKAESKPDTGLDRLVISYTDEQLGEWRRDTLATLGLWLTSIAGHEPPPMRRTSCVWPRPCQYLSCCEQNDEKSRVSWLLGGNYREVQFDPMKG